MQTTLEPEDLKQAVRDYLRARIPVVDGDELPIVFTAGRGDKGTTATVTHKATPVETHQATVPSSDVEGFAEAQETALRRNEAASSVTIEESAKIEQEALDNLCDKQPEDIFDDEPISEPQGTKDPEQQEKEPNPEVNDSLEEIEDVRDVPTKRKASSLFGGSSEEDLSEKAPKPVKRTSSIFAEIGN